MTTGNLLTRLVRDSTLRCYFLGKLNPRQQARLEERYFQNSALVDRLEFVEETLIDAYLTGKMSQDDRFLFETNYLVSERRREKLERTRALIRYVKRAPMDGHQAQLHKLNVWRLLPVTLGASAVFVLVWLYGLNPRIHSHKARSQSVQIASDQPATISLTLRSYTRNPDSGVGNFLEIPTGDHKVALSVFPKNAGFPKYLIECSRDGNLVSPTAEFLTPEGQLTVHFESSTLSTGVYFLEVTALDSTGRARGQEKYAFEVLRH